MQTKILVPKNEFKCVGTLLLRGELSPVKEISLSQGKVALVSDEDYEEVSQFKWSATCCPDGRTGKFIKWYAHRKVKVSGKRVTLYLHRCIMKTPKGMVVDHHDHDGLNCQRENMTNTLQKHNCTRGNKEVAPCL